ncbi:unnamed protein product, partial [Amoebophrya sp. A25]
SGLARNSLAESGILIPLLNKLSSGVRPRCPRSRPMTASKLAAMQRESSPQFRPWGRPCGAAGETTTTNGVDASTRPSARAEDVLDLEQVFPQKMQVRPAANMRT